MLEKVSLTHKGQSAGELVINLGHQLYINNTSLDQLNLAAGTMIAGFGAGTWKLEERDEINTATMILSEMNTSGEMVQFNNRYASLHRVVKNKRHTNPAAKLMYHVMTDTSGGEFDLAMEHKVYFAPKTLTVDELDEQSQLLKIAATIPCELWQTSVTTIIWAVKWTLQGLCPVRPIVVLKDDCTSRQGIAW